MGNLLQDLRLAIRSLARNPKFSLAVILTLSVGIGDNVANFSLVNAFILRPLDFEDPEQLSHIWRADRKRGFENMRFSLPTIEEFERSCSGCQEVAAYNYFGANLAGGDELPEGITAGRLTHNMLPLLGADTRLGRGFSTEDANSGGVVILGHGIWQRRFGGSQEVLGQSVLLNEVPHTVIGVMPESFNFPYGGVKAWVVIQPGLERWDREYRNFMPVVRRQSGTTAAQVASELDAVFQNIAQQHYPDELGNTFVEAENLRTALLFLADMVQLMMLILMVASGFVLLIICTNVANLFLVRSLHREREIAVRAALGAGRLSLVRQLLAEGLVLALAGGALGVLTSYWTIPLVGRLIPEDLYRVGEIGIDSAALAVALGVSLLTTLLVALPPILQTFRTDMTLSLKEATASSLGSVKARRSQNFLVVSQISLAAVLMVGTGLAVRSFTMMRSADPGFNQQNVLTMNMILPRASFPHDSQVLEFHDAVRSRIEAVPGIESVAFTSPLPLNFESWGLQFSIAGRDDPSGEELDAGMQYVSPGYLESMGIRLLQGRDFTVDDAPEGIRVALINRTMAERFWPDADSVGQQLRFESGDSQTVATIVGVVADSKQMFLSDSSNAMVYFSQEQRPLHSTFLVVRTQSDPLAMTQTVREAVWSVRPDLPLSEVRSMAQVVDQSLQPWKWSAYALGGFSVFALVLAGIGIYGVVAYAASQRTGEIGVRMALGADPADIRRMILKKALVLTGIGLAVGAVIALGLNRAMASFLFGVGASDPLTYIVVLGVLGTVSLVAAAVPARQASQIDPSVALRNE